MFSYTIHPGIKTVFDRPVQSYVNTARACKLAPLFAFVPAPVSSSELKAMLKAGVNLQVVEKRKKEKEEEEERKRSERFRVTACGSVAAAS